MFKIKFSEYFTPGLLLGLFNLDDPFITWIKSFMSSQFKYNINYLQITDDTLKAPKIKKAKDINSDELGMISLTWLEKYQNLIPGLIIQAFDITDYIINAQNIDLNQICEPIIKNINSIKNIYQQSNQLIIIKSFKAVAGVENNMKNIIAKYFSFKESNIFFINDIAFQDNNGIIKVLSKLIIENLYEFYNLKIKYYINKYNSEKSNEQKEYAIKYLIKIFFITKISNIIDINKKINFYNYINTAYNILIQIDKNSYLFSNDNLKIKYFEIKNLADFLLEQILLDSNNNQSKIETLILKHLIIFDCKNFYYNKNANINNNNLNNEFRDSKDILFINMKWKYSWLKFLSDKYKSNNSNSIINSYILNNLYHIYIFLKREPNFAQDINSIINNELQTKKINQKYIEKIPKLSKLDGDNISCLLNDEENLQIYISNLINDAQNIIDPGYILKMIKEYFINNKLNHYDFYLLNKHCKDNCYNEDFNNILIKIFDSNINNIYKFPNVYSHISNKINKFLSEINIQNNQNNELYFKIIKHYIHYMSFSNKEFSKEEKDKINEILSNNNNIDKINFNKIIHLNNIQNKLFNIEINFSKKEVEFLDVINININISLLKKDILINIEKIIIYFPLNKINKEENKNYKEIIINKELTKDNPIQINLRHLINSHFNKLYITNIELYLKNKIIINLLNKDKKEIIYYNKENSKINVDDIVNIDIFNNNNNKNEIIYIGKEENHLLNINYNLNSNYKDIYIKQIKLNITLLKEIENQKLKNYEEANNYEFKILKGIKGYQIIDNKYLIYEYDNINLEKDLPLVEYLLKIKDIGNYLLNYKFTFNLINNNCPDDICVLKYDKKLKVQCIEPFIFSNEISSSLYFINPKTKIKFYPINYPINIISYIENKLSENIIIKKIEHISNNNSIEINSSTEYLFSKIKNFKIKFSSNEIISIKSVIKSNNLISGSIGKLKILWVTTNLFENKFFSDEYINNTIFDLIDINIDKISLIIEGKYLKMRNKYQIYIKNNEEISKIIQMNIKEENDNKKYILCGKTNMKGILTPYKEIKILYNIYDNITGMYIDENKENTVFKFDNSIIINEYGILDNKNKFSEKALKNIIYFIPELFKI